jgi:hypothetical protein
VSKYPKLTTGVKKAGAALSRLHAVFDSNPFEAVTFFAGCKHFKLVNHTFLMIGTQARLPCRAFQLGEAVLQKNPVSHLLLVRISYKKTKKHGRLHSLPAKPTGNLSTFGTWLFRAKIYYPQNTSVVK